MEIMNSDHEGVCSPWWPKDEHGFYLYVFPLYGSIVPNSTKLEKFFSERFEDMHPSGAVAFTAGLFWRNLPLRGRLKEAADEFKSECHGEVAFDLYFLSAPPSGIWCAMHGHVKNEKLESLQMTLRQRPPKSKPPEEIVECSKTMGGFPDGFREITKSLGPTKRKCSARADMVFVGKDAKIEKATKAGRLAPFKIVDQSVNLEAPDKTRATVLFYGRNSCSIEARSVLDLVPNQECFEIACEALLQKIKPLLKSR